MSIYPPFSIYLYNITTRNNDISDTISKIVTKCIYVVTRSIFLSVNLFYCHKNNDKVFLPNHVKIDIITEMIFCSASPLFNLVSS